MGDELVWEAFVPIPFVSSFTYKYAILNDKLEVVKWESHAHTVTLPERLEDGSVVQLLDVWTDSSQLGHVFSRSAFTRVILANRTVPSPSPMHRLQGAPGEVIVRFQIRWVSIWVNIAMLLTCMLDDEHLLSGGYYSWRGLCVLIPGTCMWPASKTHCCLVIAVTGSCRLDRRSASLGAHRS